MLTQMYMSSRNHSTIRKAGTPRINVGERYRRRTRVAPVACSGIDGIRQTGVLRRL